jgi:hypothetical protein
MRDFDAFMHSVIAALVGAVGGILVGSLLLSAHGAAAARLGWDDLSSIGTFWGGHLTALSILIIGVGLVIQARQLRTQVEAERNEARRSRLDRLTSQLPVLGSNLCAYYLDGSTTPSKIDAYKGLQPFAAAILNKPNDLPDLEIWVDTAPLMSYAHAAKEVQRIATELEGSLANSPDSIYGFVYHKGICEYADRILKARSEFLSRLRHQFNDETILSGLAELMEDGWKIESNTVQGVYYTSARCFDPFLKRIDILRADDPSPQLACQMLVKQWIEKYR